MENEPLGMGGNWQEGSSVTSGSSLVRMKSSAGFEPEATYLIRLASVAEYSLAIAW